MDVINNIKTTKTMCTVKQGRFSQNMLSLLKTGLELFFYRQTFLSVWANNKIQKIRVPFKRKL